MERGDEVQADNQQVISQMKELTDSLRNERFSSYESAQHVPSIIPPSSSFDPGSSFQLFQWIPCRLLSHTSVVVVHGFKAPLATTHSVNGNVTLLREEKVLTDKVIDFAKILER